MKGVPLLIAVMGPTASGKTPLAEAIADDLDAQLINADAFQIYRGMDIGTAKPEHSERYWMLDIRNPDEAFGVGEYVSIVTELLKILWDDKRNAVVVGGTGLYIRALLQGYTGMSGSPDPALRERLNSAYEQHGLGILVDELLKIDPTRASQIDLKNPARVKRAIERAYDPNPSLSFQMPPFERLKVALSPSSEELEPRIIQRVHSMVQNGWVEEVRRLVKAGYASESPGFRAIGYQQMARFLAGKGEFEEAVKSTVVETRRYAKRQRTWLRSEPNLSVLNFHPNPLAEAREKMKPLRG